jgi:hypothetical protein
MSKSRINPDKIIHCKSQSRQRALPVLFEMWNNAAIAVDDSATKRIQHLYKSRLIHIRHLTCNSK